MSQGNRVRLAALIVATALPIGVHAALLTFTLGSATPSFTDGQTGIGTATFNAAVAGNPAPFNGFIGSDVNGPNFSGSWAYNYAAISGVASATLTIGIYDHDSAATGNQVGSFLLGGVDLTSLLNTAFEGHGGTSGEYDIYTVTLPSTTFAALQSGTPGMSLSLQAPGLGVLGDTPFNGAGLDFSTLTITTSNGTPAPEPGTLALAALSLMALGFARRRKR